MTRPSWDESWMNLAHEMGRRSRCSRMGVGAVIVSATNRIVATGYNGAPAGLLTAGDCTSWCDRATKDQPESSYQDCVSIHAEANALLFCDRRDREHGSMYVSSGVCWDCAKLLGNSGLAFVHYVNTGGDHRNVRRSHEFMEACGLEVRSWTS